MFLPQYVRDNLEAVSANVAKRKAAADPARVVALYEEYMARAPPRRALPLSSRLETPQCISALFSHTPCQSLLPPLDRR